MEEEIFALDEMSVEFACEFLDTESTSYNETMMKNSMNKLISVPSL